MPKSRKTKLPVTQIPYDHLARSTKQVSGHHLIRKFHFLLKLQEQLQTGSASTSHKLQDVQKEIESLGGLEAYQRVSVRGQNEVKGGGTEKVFVRWLTEMEPHKGKGKSKEMLSLLEVGAVKPDNYAQCASWIACTPIDLHSRHPLIREQDFLKMDMPSNRSTWDAISLSLVLNFVPNPRDRGRMLSIAHNLLKDGGYLFLVLPLPCVANSRYCDLDYLGKLMSVTGFKLLEERWKSGGKMGYWLYQKTSEALHEGDESVAQKMFRKKKVLRVGKSRNNFSILL